MTKFFTPRPDEGDVQWLSYAEQSPESTFYIDQELSARAGGEGWEIPPLVRVVRHDDNGAPLRPVTLPWLSRSTVALQDAVIEPLGRILTPHGELRSLRVEDPGVQVSIFVPPWIEGLLDEEASSIDRFPSSGRIMRINKLVLREQAAEYGAIRLVEASRGATYFRSDVVDQLLATGLVSGTHFRAET